MVKKVNKTEYLGLCLREPSDKYNLDENNLNLSTIDSAVKSVADDVASIKNMHDGVYELVSSTIVSDDEEITEINVEGAFEKVRIYARLSPTETPKNILLKLNDLSGVVAKLSFEEIVQFCEIKAVIENGSVFAYSLQAGDRNQCTNLQCTPFGSGGISTNEITKITLQSDDSSAFAVATIVNIYAVSKTTLDEEKNVTEETEQ